MFRQRISSTAAQVGACSSIPPVTKVAMTTMSRAGGLTAPPTNINPLATSTSFSSRSNYSLMGAHNNNTSAAPTSSPSLPSVLGGCRRAFSSGRATGEYGDEHYDQQQGDVQRSELHMAALNGNLRTVIEQVTQGGIDPNQMDSIGYTSLHLAAGNGHLDIVDWLLDGGITDVNAGDPDGSTPLHLACMYGHTQIAKVLLKHYALLDVEDERGYLPLHRAAESGNVETVNLLLSDEYLPFLDIDAASAGNNATALHIAALGGHEAVVEALLDTGLASATVQDMNGKTPRDMCNASTAESNSSSSINGMLLTAEGHSQHQASQREAKSGSGGAGGPTGVDMVIIVLVLCVVFGTKGDADEEKKEEGDEETNTGAVDSSEEPLDAFVLWWNQITNPEATDGKFEDQSSSTSVPFA